MNSNNSHYFTNNFYINNVDRVIVPTPHPPPNKHAKDEVCVEDIMDLCHKNFRNILPNKINYNFDSKTFLFPFEKNQIIELISQIDTCVQLLLQVVVFFGFLRIFFDFFQESAFVPKSRNPDQNLQSLGGEILEKRTVLWRILETHAQIQNFLVHFRKRK